MATFNLALYDTVEDRLTKFWSEHAEGRVLTVLLSDPNNIDEVVVRAEIYANREDTRPVSTGLAFEKRGAAFKDGANFTSHLENAETSAIGRALANWTFKAKKDSPRPSQTEMAKVNRGQEEPPQAPSRTEETIKAYKAEIRSLALNADLPDRIRTVKDMREWATELCGFGEGLLLAGYTEDQWRLFRDAVKKACEVAPAVRVAAHEETGGTL